MFVNGCHFKMYFIISIKTSVKLYEQKGRGKENNISCKSSFINKN